MILPAKKNDGVSPVIGTILLVAITVVLVAIISAVVMGMAGGIETSHVVGVKVVQGADAASYDKSLQVTITGGDVTGLRAITVYNGSVEVNEVPFTSVGVPMNFNSTTNKLGAGPVYLSIVGQFADGNQTIYSGMINLV